MTNGKNLARAATLARWFAALRRMRQLDAEKHPDEANAFAARSTA